MRVHHFRRDKRRSEIINTPKFSLFKAKKPRFAGAFSRLLYFNFRKIYDLRGWFRSRFLCRRRGECRAWGRRRRRCGRRSGCRSRSRSRCGSGCCRLGRFRFWCGSWGSRDERRRRRAFCSRSRSGCFPCRRWGLGVSRGFSRYSGSLIGGQR